MSIELYTPSEIGLHIAKRAKDRRLELNLSQHSLSDRSGVSLSVIKKFERSGKISLESLLKLSLVLGCLSDFNHLFKEKSFLESSLDELMKPQRKRGRR